MDFCVVLNCFLFLIFLYTNYTKFKFKIKYKNKWNMECGIKNKLNLIV